MAARRAHNPKVVGSNPTPATTPQKMIAPQNAEILCTSRQTGHPATSKLQHVPSAIKLVSQTNLSKFELRDEWGTNGGRMGDEWGTNGGRMGDEWGTNGGRMGDEWGTNGNCKAFQVISLDKSLMY